MINLNLRNPNSVDNLISAAVLSVGIALCSQNFVCAADVETGTTIKPLAQGESIAAQGDWSSASRMFSLACENEPINHIAYYDLGVALFHLNDLEKARHAEEAAVKLRPDFLAGQIQLSTICYKLGDFEAAKTAIVAALAVDPGNTLAKRNLARIEEKLQSKVEPPVMAKPTPISQLPAPAVLTAVPTPGVIPVVAMVPVPATVPVPVPVSAKEEHSSGAEALLQSAKEHSHLGQWSEALDSYRQAREIDSNLTEALIGEAIAEAHVGQAEIAKECLRDAMNGSAKTASWPHVAMSAILVLEDKIDEAQAELTAALAIDPNDQSAKTALAELRRTRQAATPADAVY